MKQSVIFGAGNIGRGFMGELFSESGYAVTFVDIEQTLLDAINEHGAYTVQHVDNIGTTDVRVQPACAVHAGNQQAVIQAVSRAEIMATAVGARALPHIAPNIAAGVRQRMQTGIDAPLNCIVCENLKGAAGILRDMVKEHLTAEEQSYLDRQVGFVNTVIGRMVPPLTPEMRHQDPARIRVEPYKELPVDLDGFVGDLPDIKAMEACDHFEVYTARKLYIHNCGHAVLAYLGYLKGYTYGYQALADAEIDAQLQAAWQESIAGQVAEYGVEADWLRAHAQDLHRRFANRALGDTVFRLGRDPIRKLGPTDRLVAPARLAEKASRSPTALSTAIAAALCFDPSQDPIAMQLQAQLAERGLAPTLAEVCQIQSHDPLFSLVREKYDALRATNA